MNINEKDTDSPFLQLLLESIDPFLNSLDPDLATSRQPFSMASWNFLYSGVSSTSFDPLSVIHSEAAGLVLRISNTSSNSFSGLANRYVPDCMQA